MMRDPWLLEDGNWTKQKMSQNVYEEKLRWADAEYSRILRLLAEKLRERR